MIINHNVPALSTYNQLTKNNKATAKSLNKLSSGQQINTAADDASGLAISEKMRAQIRGLDQASVNSQDAISLIQTAEGNLGETEEILQRMRELADKAANDTKVASDRDEIQKEMNQLTNEINRIGNTAEFNTMKLLNGGGTETKVDPTTKQIGAGSGLVSSVTRGRNGTSEKGGVYEVTMSGIFTQNDTLTIQGQTFTFVNGSGDAARGEIGLNAATALATDVAANTLLALQANKELKERFDIVLNGTTLEFTEKATKAVGVSSISVTVNAAGTGAMTNVNTGTSIKEVLGEYTFSLQKAVQKAGTTLTFNGVTITAADGDTMHPGQFKIGDNIADQAKSIASALNSSTLGNTYIATANDAGQITLTQREGHGSSVDATTIAASTQATSAQQGQYNIELKGLINAGGKFTIDGQDIAVTDDANDARLMSGKAILAAGNLKDQTNRLIAAINTNANLKDKYTASNDNGKLRLEQDATFESIKAPVISTNTSSTKGFQAKMQIGANAYQSMTVEINDMRALALGIVGTAAGQKVVAKDTAEAQYTKIKNVNNGTDDTSVEYALDVSNHENATAAISVIDDAIQKVSAERSRLGAYQNRLEHTINNLGASSQNLTEAESRIRDTDMAKEMMAFQKNNILSQAAQSMLAQANQLPQGVLQLLR